MALQEAGLPDACLASVWQPGTSPGISMVTGHAQGGPWLCTAARPSSCSRTGMRHPGQLLTCRAAPAGRGRLCQSTGLTAQDGHVRSASVQSAQGSGSSSASANPTQAVSSDELLPWKQYCCSASVGTSRDTASQKPGLMTHLSAPLFHQQLPAYATESMALGHTNSCCSLSLSTGQARWHRDPSDTCILH